MMGSVVFTGVSLSKKLMGRWLVVMVYNDDIGRTLPPFTVEFDKEGRLTGRSRCGTFRGQWSTGNNELRIRGLVPSGCNCGNLRELEQQVIRAMGSSEQHKLERDGLVLLKGGKPVAVLVQQRT